jgi:hypothetical protein
VRLEHDRNGHLTWNSAMKDQEITEQTLINTPVLGWSHRRHYPDREQRKLDLCVLYRHPGRSHLTVGLGLDRNRTPHHQKSRELLNPGSNVSANKISTKKCASWTLNRGGRTNDRCRRCKETVRMVSLPRSWGTIVSVLQALNRFSSSFRAVEKAKRCCFLNFWITV